MTKIKLVKLDDEVEYGITENNTDDTNINHKYCLGIDSLGNIILVYRSFFGDVCSLSSPFTPHECGYWDYIEWVDSL